MSQLKERLREEREYAGWSQSELAQAAGVPVRTIENWEQGVHTQPRPRTVKLVAAALRVSWRWLLYGEEESERAERVIEATIETVQQDASTGWYRVTTDDDQVKRLDTKDNERAKQAAALKGKRARITYSERESTNINPHTNRPFLNRYFEAAEPLAAAAADDGIDVIQQHGRKTDPTDAWRMCLNKGGELAVLTLPLMPADQRSFEIQKQIAIAWAKFFLFTPLPSEGVNTAAATLGYGGAPGPPDAPPAHSDDDIPF